MYIYMLAKEPPICIHLQAFRNIYFPLGVDSSCSRLFFNFSFVAFRNSTSSLCFASSDARRSASRFSIASHFLRNSWTWRSKSFVSVSNSLFQFPTLLCAAQPSKLFSFQMQYYFRKVFGTQQWSYESRLGPAKFKVWWCVNS